MSSTVKGNQGSISPPELHSGSGTLTETLDQLLASKTFSRSGQLKRLLVYLREATVSTDPSVWSETSIGANAFGRKDFNTKLDEYYAGEGAQLPYRLRFEHHTYRPFVEPYVPPPAELAPPIPVALPPP